MGDVTIGFTLFYSKFKNHSGGRICCSLQIEWYVNRNVLEHISSQNIQGAIKLPMKSRQKLKNEF